MKKAFNFKAILAVSILLGGATAWAERDQDQAKLDKALSNLAAVESQAKTRLSQPDLADVREMELRSLTKSNLLFLDFLDEDCLNVAIKAGSVGGSAMSEDVSACKTKKINQRAAELSKRYVLNR